MTETALWDAVGRRSHHGVNIPLFSLRTAQSCGIGEFLDFLPVIAWCSTIGFDVIQTLPLNDTGHETSPYSALSAFALNPIHLSLTQLPEVESTPNFEADVQALQQLNHSQTIDYPAVRTVKEAFFKNYLTEHGAELAASKAYGQFVEENPWLEPYSQFKALKQRNEWKSWENWTNTERVDATEHILLQFLCFQQMRKVKQSAQNQGVMIKGDIPILLSRDSADVWSHPELFILSATAGAPPDMFAQEGQKWGFPLYNWEEMEKQDFKWWKERLSVAESLYHLYRLDHIVGFFRIWSIPIEQSAKEGHFQPETLEAALEQGKKILSKLLDASTMLPIGEDLGVVPPEARVCMQSLGICGTKVMRWERRWEEDKGFIDIANYPELSMTTVSTHDSETLQLWWTNQQAEAELFSQYKGWAYEAPLSKEHQISILEDSHKSASFFHINLLQEYLTLFPELSWPTPEEERINIPGVLDPRNWSYKFKPSVEEFTSHQALAKQMSSFHA